MKECACGSNLSYNHCCQPLHDHIALATSPSQLMRSRYCAFVMKKTEYLVITHSLNTRDTISAQSIEQWNNQCDWRGLHLVTKEKDTARNLVEFIAWYKQDNKLASHHELSQFHYEDIDPALASKLSLTPMPTKAWYYHSASYPDKAISLPKRNDNCICHSGKKFKKCCGR